MYNMMGGEGWGEAVDSSFGPVPATDTTAFRKCFLESTTADSTRLEGCNGGGGSGINVSTRSGRSPPPPPPTSSEGYMQPRKRQQKQQQ